jgi:hypothetical protein
MQHSRRSLTKPCELVVEPREVEAVKRGEIEAEVYRDGEIWVPCDVLEAWRQGHAQPA